MAKLFTSDDFLPTRLEAFEARQFSSIDTETLKDSVSSMVALCDRMEAEHQAYDIVSHLKLSTEQLKFKSEADYQMVDNNMKIFAVLQRNLGIDKRTMPSMEDFDSLLTRKSSKEIAMEGFTSFIKRVWKMIKEFVVAFYNRVTLFFKRLLGMHLNNTEIKDYIKKNLDHIRVNDLRVPIDNQITITTRLPMIFAKPDADKFTTKEIETVGLGKIGSHLAHLKALGGYYNHQVTAANSAFGDLRGLLTEYVKRQETVLTALEAETKQSLEILSALESETSVSMASMESFSVGDIDQELVVIIDKLAEYAIKQKQLLSDSLKLSPVTNLSTIPEEYRTKLDAGSANVTEVTEQTYYAMHSSDAMLSNYNIYMTEYKGTTLLKPTDTPGATVSSSEPVSVAMSDIKLVSGTNECKNIPNELNVVYKYGTLVELYEMAKQLESFSVKDSAAFVEKIGAMVVKYVKELQEIFEKSNIVDKAENIVKMVQECEKLSPPEAKDNFNGVLVKLNRIINGSKTLSEKFSKGLHSNMIDISRDMCAQIATVNHDAATEIFNYVYKCTKEYK